MVYTLHSFLSVFFSIMFHFMRKKLLNDPITKIYFLQNPSLRSHSNATKVTESPFSLTNYLINSCGLPSERALSIAKRFNLKNLEKPNSVLKFLKNNGFSKTHIANIINKRPQVLFAQVESSLRPKLKFFQGMGLSNPDLVEFLASHPIIFVSSIKNNLEPSFDFIRTLSKANETTIEVLNRYGALFQCNLQKMLAPKVAVLRNYGVPDCWISKLLMTHSRIVALESNRFNESVEMIKEMGFNPLSHLFIEGVRAMTTMNRATWDSKFEVYRSLGWSDEEILGAFRLHPSFMTISEEKIKSGIEFFVKTLGWTPSMISRKPTLLLLSLEKRIKPRYEVLRVLMSKGLIKSVPKHRTFFIMSEKKFSEKYVVKYQGIIPDIGIGPATQWKVDNIATSRSQVQS